MTAPGALLVRIPARVYPDQGSEGRASCGRESLEQPGLIQVYEVVHYFLFLLGIETKGCHVPKG